jgi:hypothetical protein
MKHRDDQITIRLAGELRAHLEDEAQACGRSLSNLIRHLLIEHTAERVAAGAVPAVPAATAQHHTA